MSLTWPQRLVRTRKRSPFVAGVNANPAAVRLDSKLAKRQAQANRMILSVGACLNGAKFFKNFFSRLHRHTRPTVGHGHANLVAGLDRRNAHFGTARCV